MEWVALLHQRKNYILTDAFLSFDAICTKKNCILGFLDTSESTEVAPPEQTHLHENKRNCVEATSVLILSENDS